MTLEEPDWGVDDLRWALDWRAEQDLLCTGCGQPRDETMVHENDAPFYEVRSLVCWHCRATQAAARDAAESNGGQVPPGRYYAAIPRAGT